MSEENEMNDNEAITKHERYLSNLAYQQRGMKQVVAKETVFGVIYVPKEDEDEKWNIEIADIRKRF